MSFGQIESESGKAIVITPGELESFVRDVNHGVLSLLDDMIQQTQVEPFDPATLQREMEQLQARGALLEDFEAWINDVWGPFFRDNIGFLGSLAGSAFSATLERAEVLRQEYAGFYAQFVKIGGVPSRPEEAQPAPAAEGPGSPETLGILKVIAIAVAVIVGVVGVIWLVRRLIPQRRLRPETKAAVGRLAGQIAGQALGSAIGRSLAR